MPSASASHASPMPSELESVCDGLETEGQLSTPSKMPSPSLSIASINTSSILYELPLAVE